MFLYGSITIITYDMLELFGIDSVIFTKLEFFFGAVRSRREYPFCEDGLTSFDVSFSVTSVISV